MYMCVFYYSVGSLEVHRSDRLKKGNNTLIRLLYGAT